MAQWLRLHAFNTGELRSQEYPQGHAKTSRKTQKQNKQKPSTNNGEKERHPLPAADVLGPREKFRSISVQAFFLMLEKTF